MIYQRFVKRFLDILVSICLLPVFVVVYLVVGALIKWKDHGPVLYVSKRIGKDFRVFNMYKFRSMIVNAPDWRLEDGTTYNSADDSRVTRIGRILRSTSIDEVPQLINILQGKMSWVGPRPGDVESIDTYLEDEKGKMKVLPGITGYSQAYYRNSIPSREKRLLDAWYANHITFVLDMKIIARTAFIVFRRKFIHNHIQADASAESSSK